MAGERTAGCRKVLDELRKPGERACYSVLITVLVT
jgi:hypothetical protein